MAVARILIIEDDTDYQQFIFSAVKQALDRLGRKDDLIQSVESFGEALRAFDRENRWDLIVTDLRLPSSSNRRAPKEMLGKHLVNRACQLNIPVIVVSSAARPTDVKDFLRGYNIIDFFDKGDFNEKDFIAKVVETFQEKHMPCDILIISANPLGTDRLQLEREAKLISNEFQQGPQPYTVKVVHAVQIETLSRHLLEHQPVVLHFSGHGRAGEIILENETNQAQPVSADALAKMLSVITSRVKCVVLNACFSLDRADALGENVSCVIGMSDEIDDESALTFAKGFYRGLAFGKGYYAAFELGRAEISLMRLPDGEVPHFFTRDTTLLDSSAAKIRTKRGFDLPPQKQKDATKYPLWFGTNRLPLDPDKLSKGFSNDRARRVYYGTCQVSVSKSHKIGSIGSPWWQRLLKLSDDRLTLDPGSVVTMAEDLFWSDIKRTLYEQNSDKQMGLVFIHGFNVSFEHAALRAAQIGVDLQVPGITAFYSWPSMGKLTGYAADEAAIQASEPYITEFLTAFGQSSGAGEIHVIAHSMGNRGLFRSIHRIVERAASTGKIPFGQIFLMAPDEDIDVFRDLAAAFGSLARHTTLYVSSKDRALASSGIIHNHPRAGFCPPHTVVPGIDTIEVSNIDLTLLGHGYYADARDVLQDMHSLLVKNLAPDQRFGLREQVSSNNERFWVISA